MRIIFLLAALGLAACHPREEAHLVAAPLPVATSAWMELTPEAAQIGDRLFTATCSDFPGTDPAFRFWARRGAENKVVVYFDGGGACWDDVTCSVPRRAGDRDDSDGFYKAELLPGDDPNRMSGIFNLADPRNPLRDWSFVFVPYCTGDVHSGSNTAHYTNADTGEPFTIEHRGADNFAVILQWMRANFSAPDEILVTGSSAGAYGAATHYAEVRDVFPAGRAIMLGDAGQGVTTSEFLEQRNGNWNYVLPKSVFGDAPLSADDDIVAMLAARYPGDRFAQYTTAQDLTQASFYALMGAPNACRGWTQKMTSDLTRREQASNFRAYLAAGQSHTILRSPLFYTERSGGAPFLDWVNATLAADDANWSNRVCDNCTNVRTRCPF